MHGFEPGLSVFSWENGKFGSSNRFLDVDGSVHDGLPLSFPRALRRCFGDDLADFCHRRQRHRVLGVNSYVPGIWVGIDSFCGTKGLPSVLAYSDGPNWSYCVDIVEVYSVSSV